MCACGLVSLNIHVLVLMHLQNALVWNDALCADAERPNAEDGVHGAAMQPGAGASQMLFGDAQPAAVLDAPAALQGKKLRLGKKV